MQFGLFVVVISFSLMDYTGSLKVSKGRRQRRISTEVTPVCPKGCELCSEYNGCLKCLPKLFILLERNDIRQIGICLPSCPVGYFGVRNPEMNKCTITCCYSHPILVTFSRISGTPECNHEPVPRNTDPILFASRYQVTSWGVDGGGGVSCGHSEIRHYEYRIIECKIDNCEACFSRNFCTKCKEGLYLHKGRCYSSCPEGFAALNGTVECSSVVQCELGEWGSWGPCTKKGKLCGFKKGTQNRTREALQPSLAEPSLCPQKQRTGHAQCRKSPAPKENGVKTKRKRKNKKGIIKKTGGTETIKKPKKVNRAAGGGKASREGRQPQQPLPALPSKTHGRAAMHEAASLNWSIAAKPPGNGLYSILNM